MREAQAQLGERVDCRDGPPNTPAAQASTVASFVEGLGKTWKSGDRRAIHRRPYVRRKPVPRRPSMLDPHVARVEARLAAEPHLTAIALAGRLREAGADSIGDRQLRTLQRFVKSWRARTARLLMDEAEAAITIDA